MSDIKVTDEQLEALRKVDQEFHRLTKYLGEVEYQKHLYEREILATKVALDENSNERLRISEELQKQFGTTGQVDLTTGEFTKD
jgi:hypothetical protein